MGPGPGRHIRNATGATYGYMVPRGGYVTLDYGESGNVTQMIVHSQCRDVGNSRRCADPRESSIEARRAALEYNCICAEEQRYVYDWDELNRLAEARRYERHGTAGWPLAMQQRYFYDAGNVRMIKETVDFGRVGEGAAFNATTLSPYPGDYERRGVTLDFAGSTYHASPTLGTETQYLVGGARLVWASNTPGSGNLTREQRLTLPLSDLVQSTAAVVDLQSGELLEHTTFYPNGARETHRTNDDVSMQLEPVGFTGKEADEEVGLVYFGERYLIPRLGRWASVDPLSVHAVGGGEVLNGYHYVSGNLLQARDPLGLDVKETINNSHVPEEVAWGDDGAWYASAENFTESEEQRAQLRAACGSTYTQGCHDALEALSELEGITIVVFVQGGLENALGRERLSRTEQAVQFVTEQAGSEAVAGGNPASVGGTNPDAEVTAVGQVAVVAASIVSFVSDVVDAATGVVGAIKHLAEIGFERAIRALLDPNNVEEVFRRMQTTPDGGSTAGVLSPGPSVRPTGPPRDETWRSPTEWAERDHAELRDRMRRLESGYESGRHDEYPRAMSRELRRLADEADARGDLPEYGSRLREMAETYERRAQGHRGGGVGSR